MLESGQENKFKRFTKAYDLLVIKLNIMGFRGMPDRIVLGRNKLIVFFEFKRPDGKGELSKRQGYIGRKIREFGFEVYVTEKADEAIEILRSKIQA